MAFFDCQSGGTPTIKATQIYSGGLYGTVDVSGYSGYENFTIDNFSFRVTRSYHYTDNGSTGGSVSCSQSYNPQTGILTMGATQNNTHQTVTVVGTVYLLTTE